MSVANPFAVLSDAFAKLSTEAQAKLSKEWESLKQREDRLKNDQQALQEQITKMKQYNFQETDLVELNVGGNHFCTTISTLKKVPTGIICTKEEGQVEEQEIAATDEKSVLATIASGNFPIAKDKQGRIFLDRDGSHFIYILNYLRENGDVKRACIPLQNQEVINKLCIECDHFYLHRMKYLLLNHDKCIIIESPTNWITNKNWKWLHDRVTEMNKRIGALLYKGSRDGYTAAKFHELCDNKGETISIIKSNSDCVFGGYNSNSWQPQGGYVSSTTNWLFCFANNAVKQPTQFKLNGKNNLHASFNISTCSVRFGGSNDLRIYDNCNTNSNYNNIGHTYQNNGIEHALNGGTNNFTVSEIEVYQIVAK